MDKSHRCETECCGCCNRRLCCNFLMDIQVLAPYPLQSSFLVVADDIFILVYYIISYQLSCREKHLNIKSTETRLECYFGRVITALAGMSFDPFIQFTAFPTRTGLHLSSGSNSPRVGAQILSRK